MDVNQGPDVMEQLPASGNPMKPGSGSYGDGASADRLRQDLNLPGQGAEQPATQGTPTMPVGQPVGTGMSNAPKPGSVPDVLLAPTQQPDTPVSTPLAGMAPTPAAANRQQQTILILDMLADPSNSNVSEETREWASMVRDKLAGRSR